MLKQFLQLKLSQKLSPQQIQLMKLIELPLQELEDRLSREIEENPALETGKENEEDLYDNESDYEQETKNDDSDLNVEDYLSDDDVPDYKLKTNNYSDDDEEKSLPFISGISFNQFLKNQLTPFSLNENDSKIAEFLVGSVDQSGYIRTDLIDIVDDLAFTMGIYTDIDSVTKILNKIHLLDPPGVGARDLKECLILQLKRKKESSSATNAVNILTNHFDLFIKKHYKKIIHKLSISEDELREAIKQIEKLNPKPGSAFSEPTKINSTIIPDFKIEIIDNKLSLNLNSRNAPELFVSNEYKNMLSGYQENKNISKSQKQAVTFIKQKLDSAKWFIDAINQRNQTLLITMKTIMEFQNKYFLSGDESNLKPMILKDIAEKIGMDISTISRVANSKYIETPYGIKLLKSYFSEGMKNIEGDEISTIEIKKILKEIVNEENKDKPFSDIELSKKLSERGYVVARRTVSKYREQLDISVARLRKEL